jgi:hypothetical protein
MEGCVKFNPFFVREIRENKVSGEKSTGILRFESGPDHSKVMSGNVERGRDGGRALCGVVLDAVWHAAQVFEHRVDKFFGYNAPKWENIYVLTK